MKQSRSPRRRSYSQYLRGEKSTKTKKIENPIVKDISLIPKDKSVKPNIKIIRRPSSKKSKNRFTRKSNGKMINKEKDINNIEKQIALLSQKPETKVVTKPETKVVTKPETKVVTKPETKVVTKPKRDTRRNLKRGQRSHRKSGNPKGRKVSIRKKRIKPEDVEQIERKINSIRNKSSKEIRSELSKEGIHVSGKSNRLLKDIYFYSKVCNINIRHEA